jgi:glycosyltransferase involved in cell wall biosynthesis
VSKVELNSRIRSLIKGIPVVGELARRAKRRFLAARSPYERWIAKRLKIRAKLYPVRQEAHGEDLLSFVTAVWDTPTEYMAVLVESVLKQRGRITFEWIILDNGSVRSETVCFLETLRKHSFIHLYRVEENLGIIGGMRFCLEKAKNRYIMPLDSDDYVYPDGVHIVTSMIQKHHYPALLYTDEDRLVGTRFLDPYFKPDWDPVLFSNSCFIAHLCVVDRKKALELDAYSDAGSNGSHDWDTFVRFLAASVEPVHIPEVLYAWRVHRGSTAGRIDAKSYIHSSQRNVLNRLLQTRGKPSFYGIEYSPFFDRSADWWIHRKHESPVPLSVVFFGKSASLRLKELERELVSKTDYPIQVCVGVPETELISWLKESSAEAKQDPASPRGLVALIHDAVRIEGGEWPWEALAQFELYPDTRIVGGRLVRPSDGIILAAGQYFGFGRGCETPDRGSPHSDPGFFGQMLKQHSVSAVSPQFCVIDKAFLLTTDLGAHTKTLGAWLGASAKRRGVRVVYSPFLQGWTDEDWEGNVADEDVRDFLRANRDVVPETAFLSRHLGLTPLQRYLPASERERRNHIRRLFNVARVE